MKAKWNSKVKPRYWIKRETRENESFFCLAVNRMHKKKDSLRSPFFIEIIRLY